MNKNAGIKLASKLFNEDGSFKKQLDPYRYNDSNEDLYHLAFDEDGNANWLMTASAQDFVEKYNCSWDSDIVKYIYSSKIASFTRGNYSSVYVWR